MLPFYNDEFYKNHIQYRRTDGSPHRVRIGKRCSICRSFAREIAENALVWILDLDL